MEGIMATTHTEKYGNLAVERGGLYATRRGRSPEELLDLSIRERVAAIRGKDGKVPSRACYEIGEGYQTPARVIARRVREMKRARVAADVVRAALVQPIEEYIQRVYGHGPQAA
jgi:hypothetical protein